MVIQMEMLPNAFSSYKPGSRKYQWHIKSQRKWTVNKCLQFFASSARLDASSSCPCTFVAAFLGARHINFSGNCADPPKHPTP